MQGRAVLCVAGFLHDDAGDPGAARPHRLHLRPRHHGHRRHQSRHVSSHSSSVVDNRTLLHCNESFQNHTSGLGRPIKKLKNSFFQARHLRPGRRQPDDVPAVQDLLPLLAPLRLLHPLAAHLPCRQRHDGGLRLPHVLLGHNLPRVLEEAPGRPLVGVGSQVRAKHVVARNVCLA